MHNHENNTVILTSNVQNNIIQANETDYIRRGLKIDKNITISDIAERAGVSKATVSEY